MPRLPHDPLDRSSGKPPYFISYSRKHFYAAEWLTLLLQNSGYSLWFDVQQLLPGIRWETAINDGLTEAAGVILIASKAALASPYVEKEWTSIQDAGKRVCVCVIEDLDLPERLTRPDVTVIDMRRHFQRAFRQVKEFLDNKPVKTHPHPIRNSYRFGIYWATPALIRNSVAAWLELAALNLIAMVIMLVGALSHPSRSSIVMLLPIVMCYYAARIFWQWGHHYMRREFTVQQVKKVIWAALLSLIGFGSAAVLISMEPGALNVASYGLLAMIVILFGLLVIGLSSNNHPVRYRWLPTGEASQISRRMRIERLIRENRFSILSFGLRLFLPFYNLLRSLMRFVIDAMPPVIILHKDNPHPVRFALTSTLSDAYVADRVRYTLAEYGHRLVKSIDDANYQVIIVSEATPESQITAATRHPVPPVFVLSTPITLNTDAPEAKYQWLDYRARSQTQLNAVARVLRTDLDLSLRERIQYSETFLPLNFSTVLFPQVLAYNMAGFQIGGALLIVLAAVGLLLTGLKIAGAGTLLVSAFLFACGVFLIFVEHRIYHRQANLRMAYAGIVAGFGCLIALLLVLIGLTNNVIATASPSTDTSSAASILSLLYGSLIITIAALLTIISEVRMWLPAPGSASDQASQTRPGETHTRSKHWYPGLLNVLLLAALICVIVYVLINPI